MTIDEKNILWLDLFETLSLNKKIELLDLTGKGTDIRKIFLTNQGIRNALTLEEFNKMALCLSDEFLEIRLRDYEKHNIKCVTFLSPEYPYMLKEITSPPLCLYCKGNLQLLNTFCIGVVGTRKITDYGVAVTKQFVKRFCEADITVVSGLAVGVDSVAHRAVLENQGKTIAVLAGGLYNIYPASNYQLANQMSENNLLISENNPTIKPLAYYFPLRNRIIAGLSKGVFVPEAGEKSGSLYTVNYAIEFNRDLFVVPGRITSEASRGTNSLAREYVGSMVLSPDEILERYHLETNKNEKKSAVQLDITVQLVLDYIQTEKKTFQEICDHTKLEPKELNTILTELELSGIVAKLPNNSYIGT